MTNGEETIITNLKNAIVSKVTSLISTHNNSSSAHSNLFSNITSVQVIEDDDEIEEDGFYLIEYGSSNALDDIEEDMLS